MRIAYFDCFSGISGNMILGALLDAGLNFKEFKKRLSGLKLTPRLRSGQAAYSLQLKKVNKRGLSATYFDVNDKPVFRKISVRAQDFVPHRNLSSIISIIRKSKLSSSVKRRSIAIFTRLAKAEAKVHGVSVEKVHFHEVGAIDAIIDIVGACIALEMLGIEEIYSSPLPLSKGFVKTAHGKLPLPAPAAVELLKGFPTYGTDIKGELVTPTGAAIITTLAKDFGTAPALDLKASGCGAGKYEFEHPNILRVLIGDKAENIGKDTVYLIETNIDDMNPQFYDHVMSLLFKAGALDVWLENIQMKKNRPGIKLSVLLNKGDLKDISGIILCETTSLGLRLREVSRIKAKRSFKTIKTKFGKVRLKIGELNGKIVNVMPEYEDLKKAAQKAGKPLKIIYNSVLNF